MNNISDEKPIDYKKLSEGLSEAQNRSFENFSRSIRDQFNKKGKAMPSQNMSNTKKDHVGLIYEYVAKHAVETGLTIEMDENNQQKIVYLPVDEVVERLCSAFEKLNDRVKDW